MLDIIPGTGNIVVNKIDEVSTFLQEMNKTQIKKCTI